MTRWKMTIEYDGAGFCGWQRQASDVTVQQVLEDAVKNFSGETVTLHVAGRTDSGVHAVAQVAHVDLEKETTADILRGALNFYVRPHKVAVLNVEPVTAAFHARYEALNRSYRYIIVNRRAALALLADKAWHVPKPLNATAMQTAANLLLGKHDFSTFRAQHCQSKSPIRTMDQLDITTDGDTITLHTRARSFLYHQVRNMVGSLTMVGTGQWSLHDFETAFKSCDRTKGGPTAPPQGLYFWGVEYPENPAFFSTKPA